MHQKHSGQPSLRVILSSRSGAALPRRPVMRQQTQVCIGNRTSEMPERAKPMGDVSRTASTDSGRAYDPHPIIGAAVAVMVAALYGQPTHVMVTTPLLLVMTGLGVTAGYHRLFAHHSFATFRSVERALMILGCMASCAPFFWVAIHRAHHRHSDRDGDPHSPHI